MLEPAIQQELAVHQVISRVLRALQASIGLPERDIARLTRTQPRTVRRWLDGSVEPRFDSAERIDELRAIVVVLGEMLDPDGIVAWLRSRNPNLNFRRPLDVLGDGQDFEAVLGAAQALTAGTYV
jgi:Protein of unknown function (DUF2384)